MDLGEDWDAAWMDQAAASGRSPVFDPNPGQPESYWAIVLGTYTQSGHRQAAMTMIRECTTIDPRLGGAHIHTTSKGSIVVYGTYESVEDKAAQQDLAWIKSLEIDRRQVFPRSILSRMSRDVSLSKLDPLSLEAARRRHPNVKPLYTLEVAVWGRFGNKRISQDEIERDGEAYARELRVRGYEAYFHHDDALALSMVTIGLFDHTAIDAQSGLLAPELEALMRAFPSHLVNGEILNEPVDIRRPHLGTRVQKPRVVLVPE